MPTTFEVLAQPTRRSILDELRVGECLVGDIAERTDITQPLASKRPARARAMPDWSRCGSTARAVGTGSVPEPLAELDDWLAPYRWMWESSLDALGAHLDEMPDHDA